MWIWACFSSVHKGNTDGQDSIHHLLVADRSQIHLKPLIDPIKGFN